MFEKFQEKNFWESIKTNPAYQPLLENLKTKYQDNKTDPMPVLKYSDYALFTKTGEREAYEAPYFTRRRYLVSAALLSLIYPETEEYLKNLQDVLFAVCDEWAWATPAHTYNQRDKPEDTIIDLFAAETGLALAEIYVFLKDRLDEVVKARILKELQRRIVTPFNERKYWWEWATNNWTVVCGGNVAITLMHLFPEEFEKQKPRLLQCAKQFIDAFPDDGVCLEGFSYWHYGFGNFVWFADAYLEYTNGKEDLFNNEKVEKIASYASKIFLMGNATVSVSDGVRSGLADKTMLQYLSSRYPSSVSLLSEELTHIWGGNVGWLQNTRLFFYCKPDQKNENYILKNHDLPYSGQVIVHGQNYSLFAKAGHNDEPHNHNDVGSFILATKDGQVFIDYGAGRYTRQYFDLKYRYTFFCNSSRGHSLPIVNGQEQKAGKEYCGTISHDHENKKIALEFASAYGLESLKRATRVFDYREKSVILTDSFEGEIQEITERFVSLTKPTLKGNTVSLDNVTLTFSPSLTPTISTEEVQMHGRLKTFAGGCKDCETVYVIDFTANHKQFTFQIEIK